MSQAQQQIAHETLQRLLLARVCVKVKKPLTQAAVVQAVVAAISPPLTAAEADAAVAAALAGCVERGELSNQAGKLRLEERGQQALARAWAVHTLPTIATWKHALQLVATGRGDLKKPLDADGLSARVLCEHHGLPATKTAAQAVDLLAWRALGVERNQPFTIRAVQRYLLRDRVPEDVRVAPEVWRRMLAMRVLNGAGHDAAALTRALLVARTSLQPVRNDNAGAQSAASPLADFARAVQAAAVDPGVTRFHDDRAFIGSVWEHMRGHSPVGDMSLAEFKNQLIAAHRARLLEITRADLVGAMDPVEVERSEARYQNASFHFVALGSGGGR